MSQSDPAPHLLLTLPNMITLAWLAAVPATIWLILHHRLDLAFMLFVAAGIAGWAGWLAGARHQFAPAIGALLDPVADKALLVSVYVTLAAIGVLPDWLAILVVFRDVVIVGGLLVLWMLGAKPPIKPLWISKFINTLAQLVLAAAALFVAGFQVPMAGTMTVLIWLGGDDAGLRASPMSPQRAWQLLKAPPA